MQIIDAQITVQEAQVSASQAQVEQAQATLVFAQQQAARYQELAQKGSGTVQNAQQYAAQLRQQAFAWIAQQVQIQASLLAYIDVFWTLMLISDSAVPLAFVLRSYARSSSELAPRPASARTDGLLARALARSARCIAPQLGVARPTVREMSP